MTSKAGITALIVAAGTGQRAGGGLPKQYRSLAGKSVLAHAIDALAGHAGITDIRVVIGEGQDDLYSEAIGKRQLPAPVIGGKSRRESVFNGLATITTAHVFIHDAARPFLSATVIDRLITALGDHKGAVPALPVVDTLVRSENGLGDPIERDRLVRVQTPQAFDTAAIIAAHKGWPEGHDATDDAQILRAAGHEVAIVTGDRQLEKLTYEEDFMAAELALQATMTSRTGMGFDVHAFDGNGPVRLGGIDVPHTRGLKGHSDADVALHAVTDALLGAAALGDIGDHFPPSDNRWRGAASDIFLRHAADLIRQQGGVIDHIDLTIICEQPKIGPHRETMRKSIAAILALALGKISVKATTTEKLGFTGRSEGIAAQAIATVRMKDAE